MQAPRADRRLRLRGYRQEWSPPAYETRASVTDGRGRIVPLQPGRRSYFDIIRIIEILEQPPAQKISSGTFERRIVGLSDHPMASGMLRLSPATHAGIIKAPWAHLFVATRMEQPVSLAPDDLWPARRCPSGVEVADAAWKASGADCPLAVWHPVAYPRRAVWHLAAYPRRAGGVRGDYRDEAV